MTVITDNYDFYKKLQSLEGEDKRYVYTDWNYLDLSLIKNEDLIPYK